MIELNLLPKELRKKKKTQIEIPELPYLPIAGAILGVFFLVHIILFVLVGVNSRLVKHLEVKWDGMGPQREKTEELAVEINALEKRVNAVRKIVKPDLDWARLMSGLNDSVIAGVWLSEMSVTRKGAASAGRDGIPTALNISGYAVGRSEISMSVVGKFMESLKEDEDFYAYFEEIELQNIKNVTIAGEEVMMFRLICNLKSAAEDAGNNGDSEKLAKRKR